MEQNKHTNRMVWLGSIPQLAMIGIFLLVARNYDASASGTYFIWISHAGALVFLYCLYALYLRNARQKKLITTGVFRYTRHPMYTGIFMMNLTFWLPQPASHEWHFFALQILFLITLIAAGWYQEKETLSRFGAEAEEYYRRTPRVFLFYPFR